MKGIILFLSALLLFGCTEKTPPYSVNKKPVVFVSIPPQAGLVKTIGGDLIEVRTLVGEGQSPHSYEPTARQLTRLGEADAFLTIGVPLEKALLKKIEPLYPDLPLFRTQTDIALRSMPHVHHGEACSNEHGAKDPHIWLSPNNVMLIAANTVAVLKKSDPENAGIYTDNFEQLNGKLEKIKGEIAAKLAPYKGRRFYVFHPSFGYFADEFGLEQIPIELDGKTPSPRQLTALIEQAKADGVKIIFVQKQFPADSAEAVADAIGGKVVQLDPLAEDVVANLQKIADSIADSYE